MESSQPLSDITYTRFRRNIERLVARLESTKEWLENFVSEHAINDHDDFYRMYDVESLIENIEDTIEHISNHHLSNGQNE